MPPTATAELPASERAQYDRAVNSYESKHYGKGIKLCEAVIAKFPEHAESHAILGLCLYNEGKKEEALASSRKAVEIDINSGLSWRALGMLHRAEKSWTEAMKCYNLALLHDKENTGIMTELSQLQLQRRQFDGWRSTCSKMLKKEPAVKAHWMALAAANYFLGQFNKTLETLDGCIKMLQENGEWKTSYDNSEMLLFYAQVLEESGDPRRALQHLEEHEALIVDSIGLLEARARLFDLAGDQGKAVKAWEALLEFVPENGDYHLGLRRALKLEPKEPGAAYTAAQASQLAALYKKLRAKFPGAAKMDRLPLDFLSGAAFEAALREFVVHRIQNPSLFQTLHLLYRCPEKREAIGALMLDIYRELETSGRLFPEQPEHNQPPTTLARVLYFLGQHFLRLGQFVNALRAVNRGLEHTPTNIDLYLLKARVYHHAGDRDAAFELMNQARELDTADRFLNTKCTRFALRADRTERALQIVGLFLQDADKEGGLQDMQVSWYETLAGDSYLRQGRLGKALKMYRNVLDHFDVFFEDQGDFNNFCGRKGYLRVWVQMIRWVDKVKDHKYFLRASCGALRALLQLADRQAGRADAPTALRAEPEEKQDGEEKALPAGTDDGEDEVATKHEKTEKPLNEAVKIAEELVLHCPQQCEGVALAALVFARAGELAKSTEQLIKLWALPQLPANSVQAAAVFVAAAKAAEDLPDVAKHFVESQADFQGKTAEQLVENLLAKHTSRAEAVEDGASSAAAWITACARALMSLGNPRKALEVLAGVPASGAASGSWKEFQEARAVAVQLKARQEEGLAEAAAPVIAAWDAALEQNWPLFRQPSLRP